MISTDTLEQPQTPEYFWHEPTVSWKTQEELDAILYNEKQLEDYNKKKAEEALDDEDEERLRLIEEQVNAERQAYYEYTVPRVYAHLGEDGITVQNTILVTREFAENNPDFVRGMIETDGTVSIGNTYSHKLKGFIKPKPYESWILNKKTLEWEAPVPKPTT